RGLGIAVLPRPLGDAVPGLQRIETPDQPPPEIHGGLSPRPAAHGSAAGNAGYRRYDAGGLRVLARLAAARTPTRSGHLEAGKVEPGRDGAAYQGETPQGPGGLPEAGGHHSLRPFPVGQVDPQRDVLDLLAIGYAQQQWVAGIEMP